MQTLVSTLIIFLCEISVSFGQLTLDSCQQKARRNYPAIRQFDLIGQSEEYNIKNAGKAYYPHVSLNAIGAYIIQGLPTPPEVEAPGAVQFIGIAQVNQTIWDGGATHSQKEITRATASVDSANTEVSLYTLKDRVNQLYFGILLIDEQLKQLDLHNENLLRNLDAANLSLQNGVAYRSDVDQVKVEMIKADRKKTEFNSSREAYLEMLSQLIGEKISNNEKFERPSDFNAVAASSINRPELHFYENQRQLVSAQMKMVNVNYMPKVGVLGAGLLIEPGMSFGGTTFNSFALAGLSISWNTSGLYTGKNTKQLAQINLDKINNQQETFLFNTNTQMIHAKKDIIKQQALLQQDDEIVSLKESIRKSYETRLQNGMSSMNDLLMAENGESDARSSRAVDEIQLLMSLYNLKTISGN